MPAACLEKQTQVVHYCLRVFGGNHAYEGTTALQVCHLGVKQEVGGPKALPNCLND